MTNLLLKRQFEIVREDMHRRYGQYFYADTIDALLDEKIAQAKATAKIETFLPVTVEREVSSELEQLMEQRKFYRYAAGSQPLHPTESSERYHLGVAAPIVSQGDLMGCVMMLLEPDAEPLTESDQRLAQTVAEFLGKQMES